MAARPPGPQASVDAGSTDGAGGADAARARSVDASYAGAHLSATAGGSALDLWKGWAPSKAEGAAALVLVEKMGSRAINVFLCTFLVVLVVATALVVTLAVTALSACREDVAELSDNAVVDVLARGSFRPQPYAVESLFLLDVVLENFLEEAQGVPLTSDMLGSVAPCAWCSSGDLAYTVSLSTQLLNQSLSIPTNTADIVLLDSQFNASLIVYSYALAVLSGSGDAASQLLKTFASVSWVCIYRLLSSLEAMWMSMYGSSGPPARGGIMRACLSGTRTGAECEPCGNATRMGVRVSGRHLVDLATNFSWDIKYVSALGSRCLNQAMLYLGEACPSTHSSIYDADQSVRPGPVNVVPILPPSNSSTAPPVPPPVSESDIPWNNTDAQWQRLMYYTSLSLQLNDGSPESVSTFATLATFCSGPEFDLRSLIGFVPSAANASALRAGGSWASSSVSTYAGPPPLLGPNASSEYPWRRVAGVCRAFYALMFQNTDECLMEGVVGPAATAAGDDRSASALLSDFNFSLALNSNVTFPMQLSSYAGVGPLATWLLPPHDSSMALGYQPFGVINGGSSATVGGMFGGCYATLMTYPGKLRILTDFLSTGSTCAALPRMVHQSYVFSAVVFCFMLASLVLLATWAALKQVTPFSGAMTCLALAMLCVANGGYFWFGMARWTATDYSWLLLAPWNLNRKYDRNVKEGLDQFTASSHSLGLAFWYFASVLCARACDPASPETFKCPPGRRVVLHTLFAIVYWLLRGVLCNVLLDVSMGVVPFVGWITVIRICKLPFVSPFPGCAAETPPQSAKRSGLIMFALVLITVLDALALALFWLEIRNTRRAFSKVSFSQARGRYLVYHLYSFITRVFVLSIYVLAIVFVSTVDILIGYGAVDLLMPTGFAIDLSQVGTFQFTFYFLLTAVLYFVFMFVLTLPMSSWLGRAILARLPDSELAVTFVASERQALAAAGFSNCRSSSRLPTSGEADAAEEARESKGPPLSTANVHGLAFARAGAGGESATMRDLVSANGQHLASPDTSCYHDAIFAERVFCLETTFLQWQMSHSVYHIGVLSGTLGAFLPPDYEQVAYIRCAETDTHCLVVATEDRLLISFRGTVSTRNAKTDLDLKLVPLCWTEPAEGITTRDGDGLVALAASALQQWVTKGAHPPPRVHRGFLLAFMSVRDELVAAVEDHWSKHPDRPRNLLLSGHSLGGALSAIAGAFFGQALGLSARRSASSHGGGVGSGANVGVATFGCPRVGTVAFKHLFEASTSNCWRVVRKGDPITKTPLRNPFNSTSGYHHVGIELLVDANGDMVLEPILIEHVLLHRCKHGSLFDHKCIAYLSSLLIFSLGLYGKHIFDSDKNGRSGVTSSDANSDATDLADAAEARSADEEAFYPRLWGNVAYSLSKFFSDLLDEADADVQSKAMLIVQNFLRGNPVPPAVGQAISAYEASKAQGMPSAPQSITLPSQGDALSGATQPEQSNEAAPCDFGQATPTSCSDTSDQEKACPSTPHLDPTLLDGVDIV